MYEASDEPIGVKMTYETRDDCQTREFDIGLSEDPIDGLHYPEVDGIPQKVFTVESIYERFRILQNYYIRNIQFVKNELCRKGIPEPGREDGAVEPARATAARSESPVCTTGPSMACTCA